MSEAILDQSKASAAGAMPSDFRPISFFVGTAIALAAFRLQTDHAAPLNLLGKLPW